MGVTDAVPALGGEGGWAPRWGVRAGLWQDRSRGGRGVAVFTGLVVEVNCAPIWSFRVVLVEVSRVLRRMMVAETSQQVVRGLDTLECQQWDPVHVEQPQSEET